MTNFIEEKLKEFEKKILFRKSWYHPLFQITEHDGKFQVTEKVKSFLKSALEEQEERWREKAKKHSYIPILGINQSWTGSSIRVVNLEELLSEVK